MSHSQLVEDVGVCGREISDSEIAQQKPFEHGFVDDASGPLLVGPDGFHSCRFDAGPDCELINRIEIDVRAAPGILLDSKRHQHKTQWLFHSVLLTWAFPSNLSPPYSNRE